MKATTLCFDFGNTRLKCGVFRLDHLSEVVVLEGDIASRLRELLDQYQPQKTILSSVIHHDPSIEELLSQYGSFIKLDANTPLPFATPVSKPQTIGADRLALSAYAVTNYKDQNTLIVALGSCITYNFINKYNSFIGGSISPGMEMRFKSMHELTAKLPFIDARKGIDWNFPLIGYDTDTNLLSGVILGMAAEIDGIIQMYEEKFDKFNVLLTGGDTANFARHLKSKIFADPYLILKGLNAISNYNYELEA